MRLDKIDRPVPMFDIGKGDETMLEALQNQARVNNRCILNLKARIQEVEKDQEAIKFHMEQILKCRHE